MTIESMTGFARASGESGPWRFTWELRSVNGKSLDVKARLAAPLEDLQDEVRRRLAQALGRGAVQVSLTLVREGGRAAARIDEPLLESLMIAARSVAARLGAAPPGLDPFLGVRGVIEVAEAEPDEAMTAALKRDSLGALELALRDLHAARAAEGAALGRVIAGLIASIDTLAHRADAHPARSVEAIRTRLAAQIKLLMGEAKGLDEQRLHQEAVIVAARADIREELDRLFAHVAAARALIAEGGVIGRRLDFLAQEFGREANTLCAKSGDVGLTSIGLELKAVVDQFREQVQNVA